MWYQVLTGWLVVLIRFQGKILFSIPWNQVLLTHPLLTHPLSPYTLFILFKGLRELTCLTAVSSLKSLHLTRDSPVCLTLCLTLTIDSLWVTHRVMITLRRICRDDAEYRIKLLAYLKSKSHINVDNCWISPSPLSTCIYHRSSIATHRLAYALVNNEDLPTNIALRSTCGNNKRHNYCINPSHRRKIQLPVKHYLPIRYRWFLYIISI